MKVITTPQPVEIWAWYVNEIDRRTHHKRSCGSWWLAPRWSQNDA